MTQPRARGPIARARWGPAGAGRVLIGLSGWTYAAWRGRFYPKGLAHREELAYAARRFPTIEINGTFYGLQRPEAFALWAEQTPEHFLFSVKVSRYITHMKRLRDIEAPLANFLGSGLLRLGAKLGPLLWQFPPNFRFEPERLAAFLPVLPHDTEAAARFARRYADQRLAGRAWFETDTARPLRHAFEIRHDSFRTPAFIDLLRRHHVALVCADAAGWPRLADVTSDFVYCRLHGPAERYASGYDDDALDAWAARAQAWARGREPTTAEPIERLERAPARARHRDVFIYFDNDAKVRAPRDAEGLMRRLGRQVPNSLANREPA
ncbi:MAG: DUF72 domain-containing protein [Acetobacteraceae bacterium]|nr:DUF72 domain-containing protein [Acetobacteraceae bacterium]